MYPSQALSQQKLENILDLFSKAGISVVEFRDYTLFAELVVDTPIDPALFERLYKRILEEYGLITFQIKAHKPVIRLVPLKPAESRLIKYRWVISGLAFITIFLTGYGLSQGLKSVVEVASDLEVFLNAVLYTLLFSAMLLIHEAGHLYVSKRAGIPVEGPVLLPAPPIQFGFLGTFGAIISAKTPPCTRKSLARMGLFGPLFGFLAATLVGVLGVWLSPVITRERALRLVEEGKLTYVETASLVFYLLLRVSTPQADSVIVMHPVLFAVYVMYLITFINLLPIGQLDGGHVVRSVLDARRFHIISLSTPLALFTIGTVLAILGFDTTYYTVLGFLSLILYFLIGRRGHPGVANQYDASTCKWCFIVYLILLVLTAPIPIIE